MSNQLSRNFYLGHSGQLAQFVPKQDYSFISQRKNQELIHLTDQQINIQKDAAKEISQSSLIGASVIASEINWQTYSLKSEIRKLSKQVTNAVGSAAIDITASIKKLEQRVCSELMEIKWQLAQMSDTLDEILQNSVGCYSTIS